MIELMASIAVTMIMILAMVQFFKIIGDNVALGRASIELSAKLRAVTNRLQDDLDGLTVPGRPWPQPSSGLGYLEIGEGRTDAAGTALHDGSFLTINSIYGDVDDYICFTARSSSVPFVGRVRSEILGQPPGGYTTIESNLAEIIWWLQLDDRDGNNALDTTSGSGETYTLRRRIFLIRPDLINPNGFVPNVAVTNDAQLLDFRNDNDLSVRLDPVNGTISPNNLASLTRRENRVAHVPGANNFPNLLDANALPRQINAFEGEDIMLAHVLAFDLKVYDQNAPIREDAGNSQALIPGDRGYNTGLPIIGAGAYVDLGYGSTLGLPVTASLFSDNPTAKSLLGGNRVYDTWSFDYEHDLLDFPTNGLVDEGTDGIDNGGITGIVDDVEERETAPPYPIALRGFQAHVRIIDRSTRQVRQATIRKDMTPE